MQTGFRYALEHGYELAVRLDGDGQHDPRELGSCSARARAARRTSSSARASRGDGGYRAPFARRIGIRFFAWVVSLLARQRVTDTTSGFQALNRRGIALFAADYPHDYPRSRRR